VIVSWLLCVDTGSGGGGGSDADDAGDLQLLPQQLAASQSEPHLHAALSESALHSAAVSQHVPGHCRKHRPGQLAALIVIATWWLRKT